MLPSADVAIVALTNATPSGVPETLTAQFADLVQFGEVREDWCELYHNAFARWSSRKARSSGSSPGESRATRALVDLRRQVRQRVLGTRAGHRDATAGCTWRWAPNWPWRCTHWDGNVFTFAFVTENAPPGTISKATFDGEKLTLEYFDDNHNGVFFR